MLKKFIFKAATREELAEVLSFQKAIYEADLGRLPEDGFDSRAKYLIAKSRGGELVAAFRFLGPELRPFDFETRIPSVFLTSTGSRPALLGRLCVRPDHRNIRPNFALHVGLLRLAIQCAAEQEVTDLYLYTYDNLRAFYRVALFSDTRIKFQHPEWGSVHLMRLNLADLSASKLRTRGALLAMLLRPTD